MERREVVNGNITVRGDAPAVERALLVAGWSLTVAAWCHFVVPGCCRGGSAFSSSCCLNSSVGRFLRGILGQRRVNAELHEANWRERKRWLISRRPDALGMERVRLVFRKADSVVAEFQACRKSPRCMLKSSSLKNATASLCALSSRAAHCTEVPWMCRLE